MSLRSRLALSRSRHHDRTYGRKDRVARRRIIELLERRMMLASDISVAPLPDPMLIAEGSAISLAAVPTLSMQRSAECEDGVVSDTRQAGQLNANLTDSVQGSSGKLDTQVNYKHDGEVEDHTPNLDDANFTGLFSDSGQTLTNSAFSRGLSLGDVDGDGDLDAFVANLQGNHELWTNTGGLFANSGQTLNNSENSSYVSLGDIDGDGDLDAFVINSSNHQVWTNTAGQFANSGQALTGGALFYGVSLGDVDGDGDLDAFVVGLGRNQLWTNTGGQFTNTQTLNNTARSYGVSLGDVDGDGDLDAFVANDGGNHQLWTNTNGQFADSGQTLINSAYSSGVRLGDVDGDGDLDAFVVNRSGNHQLWINTNGQFADSGQTLTNSADSRSVSLGDVDGDGDLDAFVANRFRNHQLWINTAGQFAESGTTLSNSANSLSVSLGDVDGDGDLDAFVANFRGNHQLWSNTSPNTISDFGDAPDSYGTTLANDGARHDTVGPTLGSTRDGESDAVAPLDGSGDGADDDGVTFGTIQVGQLDASVTVNVQGGSGRLDAWIDFNSDGTFDGSGEQIANNSVVQSGDNSILFDVPFDALSGQTLYARFRLSTAGGLGPRGTAADGEVEDHTLTLDSPNSSGVFTESGQTLSNLAFSRRVRLGDVDGDGDLDAFVANDDANHQLWINTNGQFAQSNQTLNNSSTSLDVSLGDVDGDGDLDAFVANQRADHQLWINTAGVFAQSNQVLSNSDDSRSVILGDVDGDGDLDAFVANLLGNHQVWINTNGQFAASGQTLINSSSSTSVRLGDVDGDGDLDALVANSGSSHQLWINANGQFTESGQTLANSASTRSVTLGDVDGDGDLDAFVAIQEGNHQVWTNTDGNFSDSGQTLNNSQFSNDASLGDVDGDGDLDVFVSNLSGNHQVWTNTNGVFANSGRTLTNSDRSNGMSLGDVDGDGDLDAFVANLFGNHQIWINESLDFGDASTPYPTTIDDDGARHIATGPRLGAERDFEADGAPSIAADGDDIAGVIDDEDGVLFGAIREGDAVAGVNIRLENAASARVDAWIDFNRDGDWNDPGEKILDSHLVTDPLQTLNYNLPPGVTTGENYARVRLSTAGNLLPTGLASDGEVEDYRVSIVSPPEVASVVINENSQNRSQITSLTVTFNTEVDHDSLQTAFTVTNKDSNVDVGTVNVDSLNSEGVTTAVLTFAGAQTVPRSGVGALGNSLADGNYRLVIDATKIRASQNVEMAADYIFGGALPGNSNGDEFFRLYGDSDGDRDVDGLDLGTFGLTFLKTDEDPNFNPWLDNDGDGDIDGLDLGQFGRSFLSTLAE